MTSQPADDHRLVLSRLLFARSALALQLAAIDDEDDGAARIHDEREDGEGEREAERVCGARRVALLEVRLFVLDRLQEHLGADQDADGCDRQHGVSVARRHRRSQLQTGLRISDYI